MKVGRIFTLSHNLAILRGSDVVSVIKYYAVARVVPLVPCIAYNTTLYGRCDCRLHLGSHGPVMEWDGGHLVQHGAIRGTSLEN